MIVVMPNGHMSMEAAPGESSMGLYKPYHFPTGTMDGQFEQNFPEIIKYVESTYRVKTDKNSRAIAGLSMGGFHSAYISMNNPDLFGYVGLFSAALVDLSDEQMKSPIYQDRDKKLATQFKKGVKLYLTAIGEDDMLYEYNKRFRADLDAAGNKYEYVETEGAHVWTCWRTYLSIFATKIFK